MKSISFYFVIGIRKTLKNNFDALKLEISDISLDKKIEIDKILLDDEIKIYLLYKYDIILKENNKYIDLNLRYKYNDEIFKMKNPIKKVINNNKNIIFNYEPFEFIKDSFLAKISFKNQEPSELMKLLKEELFHCYYNCFKDNKSEEFLENLLEQSFEELLSLSEYKDYVDINKFESIDSQFLNKYSLYSKSSFKNLIQEIFERIIRKRNYSALEKIISTIFNERKLTNFQNDFFVKIFSDKCIEFFSEKIDIQTLYFFLDFIQFNDIWFMKLFNKIHWETFFFNSIESLYYQELIFKMIKSPLFIFNKYDNNFENEKVLKKIFNFICLFKIENIDIEYTCLIPTNQIEYYKILCKEKNLNEKILLSSIFLEINNYDDLNRWFNEYIKKDIYKTLKIIIRNKEYIYCILTRETQKLIIKNELLKNIKNKKELIYCLKILKDFKALIDYNFIEFEDNIDENINIKDLIISYKGRQEVYNKDYTKNCCKCMFYVNKEILDIHLLNGCNKKNILCYNCFNFVPLNEFINHNYRENICFRIEEFYKGEIEIMLKNFDIEKFKFLDYFFKKDNFYNTDSYDTFIRSIINDFGNKIIDFNIEIYKFFENYLHENNFKKYYDLLIIKIKDFIYNQPFTDNWFDIIKYISKTLIKRKRNDLYNMVMKSMIDVLTNIDYTSNVRWYEILNYFKKEFLSYKNRITYDYLINKMIILLIDNSFSLNDKWISYVDDFNKEFLSYHDIVHYDIFIKKMIGFINSENFYNNINKENKNDWLYYIKYLEEHLINSKQEILLKELYNQINNFMENELLIKLKIYLVYLKYFLERYLNGKLNEIYEDSIKKIINSMKKDYFFEKDDFFDIFKYIQFQLKTNNSPTYNELLNSAIFIINKESFIRKNEYFEFVEYLNNILFEDDKIYLIFDYVKKINSIISLDILLEKKDWYHLVKDLNEKISSKNIGETTYKTFINAIFPLISEQKLISKRKDWFDIVQYFEKSLRNNEEYETLGNILIKIISDKNFKNMNNYD